MHASEPARRGSAFVAWLAVVCFAYYYKPILCGVLAHRLGFRFLCDTSIHGISTNHWIEIVLYCPLVWLGLHFMRVDVFATTPTDPAAARRHRRNATIADLAIALVLYGFGIHIANVIEIYSRQQVGIADGRVYDLTYFLDEGVSHYVIVVATFFVLGWLMIHDPPDRTFAAWLAPLLGVGFGVERAVGLTEAGKWFLAIPVIAWFAIATRIRVDRHDGSWARAGNDFLVRFAVAFGITLPLALGAYRLWFGSFRQPSRLPSSQNTSLALGVVALTLGGMGAVIAVGRWHDRRQRALVTQDAEVGPRSRPA